MHCRFVRRPCSRTPEPNRDTSSIWATACCRRCRSTTSSDWSISSTPPRLAEMKPFGSQIDVAIVGGGIAGLCVAYELSKRAPDLRWRLFESSDRLGGKVRTEQIEHDA